VSEEVGAHYHAESSPLILSPGWVCVAAMLGGVLARVRALPRGLILPPPASPACTVALTPPALWRSLWRKRLKEAAWSPEYRGLGASNEVRRHS
jgi:hypothetical protein